MTMVPTAAGAEDRYEGRAAVHADRLTGVLVFAPSMAIPRFADRRPSPQVTKVGAVLVQVAMLVGFVVAGTIFIGLTIMSPVAVPSAQRQGLAISAADLATAQRLGSMWWLFASGVVLSFGAAVVTLGKMMQGLASASET
jgi:hypothetical protein